jgi:maltose alpha-D-glucosyltransferase/alpha-amylase
MGEQPELDGRMAVRAPMQWTSGQNGGFSTADPDQMVRPILKEPPFGYEGVNVQDQRANPDSLLNWMATLIRARKESGAIGSGVWSALETGSDAVLALRHDAGDVCTMTLVNLSDEPQKITLDLTDEEIDAATDLFEDSTYPALRKGRKTMTLNGYGYRWIRLRGSY